MARERTSPIVLPLVVALVSCGVSEAHENGSTRVVEPLDIREPHLDREANAPLRAMSDYLAALDRFAVHAEGSIEAVLDDGQKLTYPFVSDVRVRRPNGLRSDRIGTGEDALVFFYDGRTFTLFGPETGLYAQTSAPATLDEAIEVGRGLLGIEAPGADLFFEDPYAVLTEDIVSGFRVGSTTIDGFKCHHLALRSNEVDWQIWIEDGSRPLPRRLSITSKQIPGAPQFVVAFSQWDTSPAFDDDMFVFTPPPEAEQIDFLPQSATTSAARTVLPDDCSRTVGSAYHCDEGIFVPYYYGITLVYLPSS